MHCLRRRQLAPFALMLIVWVVVLCATKNMGLTFACPYAQVSEHSVEWQAAQPAPTDTEQLKQTSSACHLSGKLLQHHLNHLIDLFIPLITLVLLLLVAKPLSWSLIPRFRDPQVPKRRPHLQLCVFRE